MPAMDEELDTLPPIADANGDAMTLAPEAVDDVLAMLVSRVEALQASEITTQEALGLLTQMVTDLSESFDAHMQKQSVRDSDIRDAILRVKEMLEARAQ